MSFVNENSVQPDDDPAENTRVCCGCLATERRLYSVAEKRLSEAFLQLTGLQEYRGGLCYMCLHLLGKFNAFRKQCRNANQFLHSAQHLNKNSVNFMKRKHGCIHKFIKTKVFSINWDPCNGEMVEPNKGHKKDSQINNNNINTLEINEDSIKVEIVNENDSLEYSKEVPFIPRFRTEFNNNFHATFNRANEKFEIKNERSDFNKNSKIDAHHDDIDEIIDNNERANNLSNEMKTEEDGNEKIDKDNEQKTHINIFDNIFKNELSDVKIGDINPSDIIRGNETEGAFNDVNRIPNINNKNNQNDTIQNMKLEEEAVGMTNENDRESCQLTYSHIFDVIFAEDDEMTNTINDVTSKFRSNDVMSNTINDVNNKFTNNDFIDISSENEVKNNDSEPNHIKKVEIKYLPEKRKCTNIEFKPPDEMVKLHPDSRFKKLFKDSRKIVKQKIVKKKPVKTVFTEDLNGKGTVVVLLNKAQLKKGNIQELVKQKLQQIKAEKEKEQLKNTASEASLHKAEEMPIENSETVKKTTTKRPLNVANKITDVIKAEKEQKEREKLKKTASETSLQKAEEIPIENKDFLKKTTTKRPLNVASKITDVIKAEKERKEREKLKKTASEASLHKAEEISIENKEFVKKTTTKRPLDDAHRTTDVIKAEKKQTEKEKLQNTASETSLQKADKMPIENNEFVKNTTTKRPLNNAHKIIDGNNEQNDVLVPALESKTQLKNDKEVTEQELKPKRFKETEKEQMKNLRPLHDANKIKDEKNEQNDVLMPALESKTQLKNYKEVTEQESQPKRFKKTEKEYMKNFNKNVKSLIRNSSRIFHSMWHKHMYRSFEKIFKERLFVNGGEILISSNNKEHYKRKRIWTMLALNQQLSNEFNIDIEFLSLEEQRKKMEEKRQQLKQDVTTCHQCCKKFDSIVKRIEHVRQWHDASKPFVCRVCRYSISSQRRLANHLLDTHARRMTCRTCCVVLEENNWLKAKQHFESHNNDELPICDCCGKTFLNKKSLSTHILEGNDTMESKVKQQ